MQTENVSLIVTSNRFTKPLKEEMRHLSSSAKRFIHSQEGAALVEYGLLIGLLSIGAISVIAGLASYVRGAFEEAQTQMGNGGIPSK